ncbi:MAG: Ig-like domain-containing protein [Dehalococcoidia bacterium]|jgi:hypothetical protein
MKYRKLGLLMVVPALALILLGTSVRPPAAHAQITKLMLITANNCLSLPGNVDWNGSGDIDQGDGSFGFDVCSESGLEQDIGTLARVLGGDENHPVPSDFTKVDLAAGQIHEAPTSEPPPPDAQMYVLAFVTNDDPVEFYTSTGVFFDNGKSQLKCGSRPTDEIDERACSQGAITVGPDNLVVAKWVPNGAKRGPGTITVRQDSDEQTIDYTVVGQPDHISLKAFDTAIQANAPVCELFSDTPTFLESVTEPETSPLVATVTDSDGTVITGGQVEWSVSDCLNDSCTESINNQGRASRASLVIPDPLRFAFTPSLNLQALGLGAPEVVCGGTDTGNVKITATLTDGSDVFPSQLTLDPDANKGRSASIILPVQSEPSGMTLSADPATLVCDGTSSSTVSANLTDDASKPVVNGNLVHYSVKALGSVNPVDARSTSGAATTSLTPLSGAINGVVVGGTWMRHVVKGATPTPVFTPIGLLTPYPLTPTPLTTPTPIVLEFVSSGLQQTTLVNCQQNPAAPEQQATAAAAAAQAAVISPPRTGSGGSGGSPWLVALPLGAFALLLVGSGLALRRRQT